MVSWAPDGVHSVSSPVKLFFHSVRQKTKAPEEESDRRQKQYRIGGSVKHVSRLLKSKKKQLLMILMSVSLLKFSLCRS